MEQALEQTQPGNTVTLAGDKTSKKEFKKYRGHFLTTWDESKYPNHLEKNMQYLIACKDSTKDGTFHSHIFIYFKNPVTLKACTKLFGKQIHDEKATKNSDCINYILGNIDKSKGKITRKHDIIELGKRPMDNGIHRMEEVLELENETQVMEQMPDTYVAYRNGIHKLMENKKSKNRFFKEPEVIWKYGPTGTNKTREAFEDGAIAVAYNNGFFTDWEDSRIICLEELRGEIPYRILLQLLDGYHNYYKINIKHGEKFVDLDKIYITSPYHPRDLYKKQVEKTDSIDQLLRRITRLEYTGQAVELDSKQE